MLPRAALHSLQRPALRTISPCIRAPICSSITRSFASAKRPPPPPTPRSRPPPPLTKDSSKSPIINQAKAEQTPIDGTRPKATNSDPLADASKPLEPIAQQTRSDEPVPGSLRSKAHEAQAAAENTEAPPADSSDAAQKPLPDLRQGLPSTFDFEFGGKKSGARPERATLDGEQAETDPTKSRDRGDGDHKSYETSVDRSRARKARIMYMVLALGMFGGAVWLVRPFGDDDEAPAGLSEDDKTSWGPSNLYNRLRARFGSQLGYYTEPTFPKLLPEVPEAQRPPFTLVLSLEDLLIHSEWDRKHGYRMAKRPGVDYFVRYLSQYYELVLFTSAPKMMADPVMQKLDPYHFIMWNLGREATKYEGGEYIKDLSYLNRPLNKTIIVDTHAPHVRNQPENAILLPKWTGDAKDPHVKDLVGLFPFLEYVATVGVEDVRTVLKSFEGTLIPEEFARRENEARKKFNEALAAERARRPKKSVGAFAGMLGMKSQPGLNGGMVLGDGSSVAEGLAQGKMLSDQIREQGQKQYEHIEQQIRENGAQWLKDEEEEQKKMIEAQMKDMKQGWFGGWSK